eukprot:882342-Rhodomonas_salina.1
MALIPVGRVPSYSIVLCRPLLWSYAFLPIVLCYFAMALILELSVCGTEIAYGAAIGLCDVRY